MTTKRNRTRPPRKLGAELGAGGSLARARVGGPPKIAAPTFAPSFAPSFAPTFHTCTGNPTAHMIDGE